MIQSGNMYVSFTRSFTKNKDRAPENIGEAFADRLALFKVDRHHPQLHDHALTGPWEGHRSINITGDWRAIYREGADGGIEWVEFVELGTHSELYG